MRGRDGQLWKTSIGRSGVSRLLLMPQAYEIRILSLIFLNRAIKL